ncbi:nitrite reductase small subunit NirD [Georgenia sp. AZ-5]|uniref:nitrite reductase small subunit NirD n=1 Tax=Georgenia sp. AZ-5 TaxID=3367526 RepID=UPI0037553CB1
MTESLLERPRTAGEPVWFRVCRVDELEAGWGEAALLDDRQVAVIRVAGDEVYAVSHRDPATGAHVMARGIVGSRTRRGEERATIASPLHKQVYDLATGECYSAPELHLPTYPAQVVDGYVEVGIAR